MATLIKLESSKTYATEENAIRAVEKAFPARDDLQYFVHATPEGRFFPVFIGERAVHAGVHWHFNVVA